MYEIRNIAKRIGMSSGELLQVARRVSENGALVSVDLLTVDQMAAVWAELILTEAELVGAL